MNHVHSLYRQLNVAYQLYFRFLSHTFSCSCVVDLSLNTFGGLDGPRSDFVPGARGPFVRQWNWITVRMRNQRVSVPSENCENKMLMWSNADVRGGISSQAEILFVYFIKCIKQAYLRLYYFVQIGCVWATWQRRLRIQCILHDICCT